MATDYITHDEFDSAMTAIKQDFDRLENKVDRGFEQNDRRFEQVLTILSSVDEGMKELRKLPARVEYLEQKLL